MHSYAILVAFKPLGINAKQPNNCPAVLSFSVESEGIEPSANYFHSISFFHKFIFISDL